MGELKNLLSSLTRKMNETISQSDQIKSYLNNVNDSPDFIKRCFFNLAFLTGLIVFLTKWLQSPQPLLPRAPNVSSTPLSPDTSPLQRPPGVP